MSELVQLVSYDDSETRTDEMHRTIEQWLGDLRDLTDEALRVTLDETFDVTGIERARTPSRGEDGVHP